MPEENISQGFRSKNIHEVGFHWGNKSKWTDKQKHPKVCRVFNYIEHLLILVSIVTGCVFISAFVSLIGLPVDIASSAIGLKVCVITPGIKKCELITLKKEEWNSKLNNKSKLNNIEVLISG